MSFTERASLHTNAIDWVIGIPNIGGEFDIVGTNWGRYAVGFDLRGRMNTSHSFKPYNVYNLTGARLYFRNYYRLKQIGDHGSEPSKGILNKLFSCRRNHVKHPKRTYYRGLYLDYSDFSFKFGAEGKQGTALTAGFTYGWLTPLYTFRNGHSLDFDMGISAGACMANVTRFTRDRDDNCYRQVGVQEKKILPMLTEVKVGFVYRFNKYPITKRYRWRYDVDMRYRERLDNLRDSLAEVRRQNHFTDSVRTRITDDYNAVYDSIAKINAEVRAKQQTESKAAAAQKAQEDKVKAAEAKEKARQDAQEAKKAKKAEALEAKEKKAEDKGKKDKKVRKEEKAVTDNDTKKQTEGKEGDQ